MDTIYCKYSPLYHEADTHFIVNFGSKNLRPIKISLPSPPRLDLIDGFGLHPDEQKFKRFEIPLKLVQLERSIMREYQDSAKSANGTHILKSFWDELEVHRTEYVDEIQFIKRFIYFMNYGYWVFIKGKPTYIPPWYFTYLNIHRMSGESGYIYPQYRIKGLYRFLFRHYLWNTTETFADTDANGVAYKVPDENGNMIYRMVDTGRRVFFGSIEPKDRRGGLTNESCHIITRIMTSTRGADKLGTIVSMGGENAETHFRKKLIPAWNAWPLWLKPIWKGGTANVKQLEFTSTVVTDIETLDCMINYTESAEDLANDGKMIFAADYDEQGKGKKTGNVQTRWQVNKQAMALGGGTNILGFCVHPSTVEEMNEGGADYKKMCDLSNFYQRKKDGQTLSGLGLIYFKSSFCLENYIDCWGNPVLDMPTPQQIQSGFSQRIGSETYIKNKRKDLYVEDDPVKMSEYRSEIRKYPEDYDEIWTGISGQLGLDNEKLRKRILELENNPQSKKGNYYWIDKNKLIVGFNECWDGDWTISKEPIFGTMNRVSSMEDYSSIEDDMVMVNRPAHPKYIIGIDPAYFSNKAESVYLSKGRTKKSETAISILEKESMEIIGFFKKRTSSDEDATDQALMAAIYWGGLIHTERNVPGIWQQLIKTRMGGYLNYNVEISANGDIKRASEPGTFLNAGNKKDGFVLLEKLITFHMSKQKIVEWMKEADEISALEQLTGYDGLASVLQCLFGNESPYCDMMNKTFGESEDIVCLGATSYNY